MELYLLYFLGGLSLLLLIYCFNLSARLNNLTRRYKEFMAGSDSVSLEGMLVTLHADLRNVSAEIQANRHYMSLLQEVFASTVRGVGVVRFNAFQNTGGNLSFAVALLDGKQDGIVLSSIYGREESRFYAKPIAAGTSSYQLSREELTAIEKAKSMMKDLQVDVTMKK